MTKREKLEKDLAVFVAHFLDLAKRESEYVDLLGLSKYREMIDTTLDKINKIEAELKELD